MKKLLVTTSLLVIACLLPLTGGEVTFPDSWGREGFAIERSNPGEIEINFSINRFLLTDMELDGTMMKVPQLWRSFLPSLSEGL